MNRKFKIWFCAIGITLFFLIAGIWYVLSEGTEKEERDGLNSVLETVTTSITPSLINPVTSPPSSAEAAEKVLYVFICGAVNNPGVYEVNENCRLYEAIELAGGFTSEADTTYHNLARTMSDGERVYILTWEETKELAIEARVKGEITDSTLSDSASKQEERQININTANAEQLATLPGIGAAKAESIIEYRTKVGQFTDIEEVMNISGIGQAMFEKIKDRITVE